LIYNLRVIGGKMRTLLILFVLFCAQNSFSGEITTTSIQTTDVKKLWVLKNGTRVLLTNNKVSYALNDGTTKEFSFELIRDHHLLSDDTLVIGDIVKNDKKEDEQWFYFLNSEGKSLGKIKTSKQDLKKTYFAFVRIITEDLKLVFQRLSDDM